MILTSFSFKSMLTDLLEPLPWSISNDGSSNGSIAGILSFGYPSAKSGMIDWIEVFKHLSSGYRSNDGQKQSTNDQQRFCHFFNWKYLDCKIKNKKFQRKSISDLLKKLRKILIPEVTSETETVESVIPQPCVPIPFILTRLFALTSPELGTMDINSKNTKSALLINLGGYVDNSCFFKIIMEI
ncbi:hypothetical protein AGLY_008311 [Aphis glycines]|uniref:Uncharacterized protein n=1 Tax=Aphis glycines TaxID=307491 RepID=A0A6G0TLJ2_APHGL|nr:hypothetical protein AGLY_008311 [Aphis glycines]